MSSDTNLADAKLADCRMMCEYCECQHVSYHFDVMDAEKRRRFTAFSCNSPLCVGKAVGEALGVIDQLDSSDLTVAVIDHCSVVALVESHLPAA